MLFGVIYLGHTRGPRVSPRCPARFGDPAGGGAGGSRGPVLPPRRWKEPLGRAQGCGDRGQLGWRANTAFPRTLVTS